MIQGDWLLLTPGEAAEAVQHAYVDCSRLMHRMLRYEWLRSVQAFDHLIVAHSRYSEYSDSEE